MKYNIQINKKIEGFIALEYDQGSIVEVSFKNAVMTDQYKDKFIRAFPILESVLFDWGKQSPNIIITKQPEDLSFDRFWNVYNYKQGKKSKAESLWKSMTDDEKSMALIKAKEYNNFLLSRSIEKAYPATWLGQRRWENEFK